MLAFRPRIFVVAGVGQRQGNKMFYRQVTKPAASTGSFVEDLDAVHPAGVRADQNRYRMPAVACHGAGSAVISRYHNDIQLQFHHPGNCAVQFLDGGHLAVEVAIRPDVHPHPVADDFSACTCLFLHTHDMVCGQKQFVTGLLENLTGPQERIGHRTANQNLLGAADEGIDSFELVRYFGAAENCHQRALWVIDNVVQGVTIQLTQPDSGCPVA